MIINNAGRIPYFEDFILSLPVVITDLGTSFDPTFTQVTGGPVPDMRWYWPDGVNVSKGLTPSPALTQSGSYYIWCSDWSKIRTIDFRTDGCDGAPIPPSLMPNLVNYYLMDNDFKGQCPNFGRNVLLQQLYLYTNQLSGTITPIDKCVALRIALFTYNRFEGTTPNVAANTELTSLQFTGNLLSTYGGGLQSCTKLTVCRFYDNFMNTAQVDAIIGDLWVNRVALGAASCEIRVDGAGMGIPSAGAITQIGDLVSAGCSVTYRAV